MFAPSRSAPFVLVSTDHGTMIVNHQDYAVQDGGVIGVSVELFNHSQYDPGQIELLLQIMNFRRECFGDGIVMIDGGANVGAYTCKFAREMTGWGKVLAFEPQEMIYYALCGNIVLNNCLNARAVCAGLGACNGNARIPILDYREPRNYGGVSLKGNIDGLCQDVAIATIDSLQFPRVDLIKLDIEGMELEALDGARKTIERCKPVLTIEHIICGLQPLKEKLDPWGYNVTMTDMNTVCIHKDDPVSKRIKFYDSREAA